MERITSSAGWAALSRDWEALDERLSPRTPYTSPLWNELWWKSHRSDRLTLRDELYLHAVRDARGKLLAVAPMMLTERPSVGPLRVRTVQCFGTDPNVTELRGLIVLPQDEVAALGALRQHFARQGQSWDWIDWGLVRKENWMAAAGAMVPGHSSVGRNTSAYHLMLPSTWEEFRASRSRNIKESIRKCYNSLARVGLVPTLRVVETVDECMEALSLFFVLHTARSQVKQTTFHPDVFQKEQDRAFLTEYVRAMAERGQLRLFQLQIGREVVATRIGFLLGSELYLYYSGYQPQWGRFSVMTTLLVEAIRWAISSGVRVVNLSTGTDVSKLRWSPIATDFRAALEVAPRWGSRFSLGAHREASRLLAHPWLGPLVALARR